MGILDKVVGTGTNGFDDETLEAFLRIAFGFILVLGAIIYLFFGVGWKYFF